MENTQSIQSAHHHKRSEVCFLAVEASDWFVKGDIFALGRDCNHPSWISLATPKTPPAHFFIQHPEIDQSHIIKELAEYKDMQQRALQGRDHEVEDDDPILIDTLSVVNQNKERYLVATLSYGTFCDAESETLLVVLREKNSAYEMVRSYSVDMTFDLEEVLDINADGSLEIVGATRGEKPVFATALPNAEPVLAFPLPENHTCPC